MKYRQVISKGPKGPGPHLFRTGYAPQCFHTTDDSMTTSLYENDIRRGNHEKTVFVSGMHGVLATANCFPSFAHRLRCVTLSPQSTSQAKGGEGCNVGVQMCFFYAKKREVDSVRSCKSICSGLVTGQGPMKPTFFCLFRR